MSQFSKICYITLGLFVAGSMTACSFVAEPINTQELGRQQLKRAFVPSVADPFSTYSISNIGGSQNLPSLTQQMNWRSASIQQNRSRDPVSFPSSTPEPFKQHLWTNDIPLVQPSVQSISTSDFGWRGLNGKKDFHSGIDIAAPVGTATFTPVSGEVLHVKHSGSNSGVIITDGERQHTFWHIEPRAGLQSGQWIKAGAMIGKMAPWGSRTHLHYSIHLTGPSKNHGARNDGNAIDPLYLASKLRQTIVPLDSVELVHAPKKPHQATVIR